MVLSLSVAAQTNAPNQWTWMGGLSTGAAPGVYGTLGTPAPGNIPPARDGASSWTDSSGNFWLFGGNISGTDDTEHLWGGSFGRSELNDLWKFNPSTKEWAWMGGSSSPSKPGQPGVYGTLGTPAAGNIPGGRDGAVSWTDSSGNFWLFGGEGVDTSGTFGVLNDVWEFNPSTKEWTWMGGSTTFGSSCFTYGDYPGETNCAQPGVYGTLGTPAAGNIPGSRLDASSWTDSKGNLWLFGGWGYDMNFDLQYFFNDLWEFNPSTKEWTWMGGTSTGSGSACFFNLNLWYDSCGEPGVYGTLGAPAASNNPGARNAANSWIDSSGNFWLFGGQGFDSNGQFSDLNDLWEFNPSTKEWTWMNGSSTIYDDVSHQRGVYGTLGTPAATNTPATRWGSVSWTDSKGNLWLFGGQQSGDFGDGNSGTLDDLWEFNPRTNEWAWMGGSNTNSPPVDGVYGTLGTPAPGNNPGDRYAASSWTDGSGNFWFFGGQLPLGYVPIHSLYANDLWEYQPSDGPLPTTATPTFSVPAGTYNGNQTVAISDATNGATIYYTTDGSTPTTSSLVYYNTPINVAYSQTIQAIAIATGCLNSPVATATYTLPPQVATPTFSVPAGTYTSTQTVTISDATPGATIYYTTNGTTPTINSLVYSGPFTVSGTEWIKAIAVASGHSNSFVASAMYSLNLPQAATPTFSLTGGRYNTPQTVTISDTTPGATIQYSTTGLFPTTNWPVYTGPITVSSSETIWAIAMAYNYYQSSVTEITYTINPNLPQAATPTFSVAGGTYTTPQPVTISDTTKDAFIFYSTDGTAPVVPYSNPITIANSETLQAIAVSGPYSNSGIASATYTINSTQDFSISTSPTWLSMNAGQSGTAIISVTPLNGFNSTVSFACSGLSSGTSCSFSPATVTPSGTAVSTMLTVTTSTATAAFRRTSNSLFSGSALTITLCFFGWKKRGRFQALLLLTLSVAGLTLFNGCGGGGSAGAPQSGTSQSGTSTVTVTATSGSLQRSTTLSLTVN